jgi:lipopolysaccharide export system permease protein
MGRTLHRYVFLQILAPFAAGLALFTFILLIARIMKLVEMVVNRGVPVFEICACSRTSCRLSSSSRFRWPCSSRACSRAGVVGGQRITALKAAGLSLYQIATPIAAFAGRSSCCRSSLAVRAPAGERGAETAIFDLARSRATVGLKEHVFNDELKVW